MTIEKIARDQTQQANGLEALRTAYALRIEELKRYAAEDEIEVHPESEKDFWSFIESIHPGKQASLVLCNSGNLKAVWENTETDHLSIQFLGNNRGEYVIFKRRERETEIARVVGIDSLQGIRGQMTAFDVFELVKV